MTQQQLLALAPALLLLGACGGSDTDETPTPGAEDQAVEISFRGEVGGEAFACGESYEGIGTTATTLSPTDFRFYVYDITLIDDDGNEAPLALEQDGKWQYDTLALLDFEDGTSTCEAGTSDLNNTVRGTAPAGDWTSIRFSLGVPFEYNHADSSTAVAPLNLTSMFWNWNGGYKFLRLDSRTTGLPSGFLVHLGSTGCDGDSEGGVTACASPNRADITLLDYEVGTSVIVADIAELFSTSNLDVNTSDTAPGCMSSQDDPECGPIFETLGLPFDGVAADPSAQSFFYLD